jgi:DNA-binding CsgD family transcriptional regulator
MTAQDLFGIDPMEADELVGKLSPREIDVIALVAQGHSNATVAKRLGMAEKTLHCHCANIKLKIGVGTRGFAAVWFAAEVKGLVMPCK